MKKFNITNPVYMDLKDLNIVNSEQISLFHNKTRDGDFNVLIDKSSGVIFLEEHNISKDHYVGSPGAATFDEYFNNNGYYEDDLRRYKFLISSIERSNYILDVGCEWGGFLKLAKEKAKRIEGAELNLEAVKYVEDNTDIKIHKDVAFVNDKPDMITMFHVLEHIPNQIEFLKILYSKMKPGGIIVIEVPHANDFLIKEINLPEFRDFTFWNEHLILHTRKSLSTLIESCGFIDLSLSNIQRYGFQNHFGWLYDKKPGGHIRYKERQNDELNKSYCNWLEKDNFSDTLICIASKPK